MTQTRHPEPTPSPSQSGSATHGDDVLTISRRLVRLAIVALAVVLLPYACSFSEYGFSHDPEQWGQFGDYVGGLLNPTIALMALVLLYQGVKLQKHELEAARAALSESNTLMQAQHLAMQKQAHEATFFQLLKLLLNIVQDLTIKGAPLRATGPLASGRGVFGVILNELRRKCIDNPDPPDSDLDQKVAVLRTQYQSLVFGYSDQLLPYHRTLRHILGFIDSSTFSEHDRDFYADLVRGQMSRYELSLLFYHCLCSDDRLNGFVALVVKYKMLNWLPNADLAHPDHYEFMSRILARDPTPTEPIPRAP